MIRRPPRSTLFPLHDALPISFQSLGEGTRLLVSLLTEWKVVIYPAGDDLFGSWYGVTMPDEKQFGCVVTLDRKSTRLNSSHSQISYAVFCLKKKTTHIVPSQH